MNLLMERRQAGLSIDAWTNPLSDSVTCVSHVLPCFVVLWAIIFIRFDLFFHPSLCFSINIFR